MRIAKKLFIAAVFIGGFSLFVADWGKSWNGPCAAIGIFLVAAGFVMMTEWFP